MFGQSTVQCQMGLRIQRQETQVKENHKDTKKEKNYKKLQMIPSITWIYNQ